MTVGGIAIVNACKKIVAKGKRVAAKMLEVNEDEIEFKDGEFVALKSNKKKTIGEVAFACYLPGQRDEMKSPIPEGDEPGLIESSFFDPAGSKNEDSIKPGSSPSGIGDFISSLWPGK